ncbi:GTP-binding protein Obg [Trichophyton tonsurans CBS 112818]|uniref:GTP-binding protein 5 n=2 Tax=Trichophyton TaxID=5550 RepID=F2PRB1_TRIEC|nr:GTP-binding protein Obg [Trichophyton tonsurans CBS 112818]EGE04429.1 GTP-binding protein 5 [Trichophyton equinum CBS 127.97]
MAQLNGTLMPFLYPCLLLSPSANLAPRSALRAAKSFKHLRLSSRLHTSNKISPDDNSSQSIRRSDFDFETNNRLNPAPSDYGRSIFQDRCSLTVHTGSGGSGCVAFLRLKYLEHGPANGGDGGTGGNILIQAVEGQTSLHKLARRGVIKAGRGKNGRGKSQGGVRGEDVLLQVPVGTVVREIERFDPVAEKERELKELTRELGSRTKALQAINSRRDQWVLYPGSQPSDYFATDFPELGPPRRPDLAAVQPAAPIYLDLCRHMDSPIVLAAGAVGGLGNPHFVSKSIGRPMFATKGEQGMRLELELELKLLADVGLVGLPNAGKSTLLRSITNSRTRVGNWAFTTLSPNIGTVVLDDYSQRKARLATPGRAPRPRFTIADIPGLIENAHLDKGLGLGFLRHVERAGILAFVVDLSAGDAVMALKGLWNELGAYQSMRDRELSLDTQSRLSPWTPVTDNLDEPRVNEWMGDEGHASSPPPPTRDSSLQPLVYASHNIYSKPWFVIGTKADLPGTQENFTALKDYLDQVEKGTIEHPSKQEDAWRNRIFSIPISAINAQGVNVIPERIVQLMDGAY